MKTNLPSTHVNLETYLPRIIALVLLAIVLLIAATGCENDSWTFPPP